jgi:hypothetical protein
MRNVRRATILPIAIAAAVTVPLGVAAPALGSGIDQARSAVGDTAGVNQAGTVVHLVGVVRCAGCRAFTLGATVSQRSSGAVGQGGVRCVCNGTDERWRLTARSREATAFRPGAARVCVWVIARGLTGKPIDAQQWCERVALRRAEA